MGQAVTRLERATLAVAAVAVFLWLVGPVYDFDVWYDLRMGEQILGTGHVPHVQSFVWEAAQLKLPYWINDEWGFGVLARLLWGLGGVRALAWFMALAGTTVFVLGTVSARRLGAPAWAVAVAAPIFVHLAGARMMPRPMLLTDVFLAAFVLVATLPRRWWWLFPAMLVVWRNVHAGVTAGGVLFGCLLVGDAVDWLRHRRQGAEQQVASLRTLLALSPLCLLALLCGPGGYRLLQYLSENFVTRTLSVQWIEEWKPTGFDNHAFWGSALVLLVGMLAGWWRGRVPFRYVLAAVGFTCLGAHFSRGIGEYAAVTLPLQAAALAALVPWRPVRYVDAVLLGLATLAMGVAIPRWPDYWQSPPRVTGALAYMRSHHAPPQLFNLFHLGGMMAWEGYPDYLPFIHGISASYPDDLLYTYRDIVYGGPAGQTALQRYGIRLMVLGYPLAAGDSTQTCDDWVSRNPRWHLVYWDDDVLLYAADGVPLEPFTQVDPLRPQRAHLETPQVRAELARAVSLAPQAVLPRCWLGQAWETAGQPEAAMAQYQTAEAINPDSPLPHRRRGELLGRQGHLAEARTELLAAWRLGVPSAEDACNLAIVSAALQDRAAARRWAGEALRLDPGFAPARRLLSSFGG